MKASASLFLCLTMLLSQGVAQDFRYLRPLDGISDQWHRIVLPDDLFQHVESDFSDLRILGITASGDTIEAPYLLRINEGSRDNHVVEFTQRNTGISQAGFTTTLDIPTAEPINRISLTFQQQNFDWRVKVEGRHSQSSAWTTIQDDYRILSIRSPEVSYQFTDITFPEADFRYYRISIPESKEPTLLRATTSLYQEVAGQSREYPDLKIVKSEDKARKQSIVVITLKHPVPVRDIRLFASSPIDFYRGITISALVDSIETEKGWKSQYREIGSGLFTSFHDNHYEVGDGAIQRLKLQISNQDNQPIEIDRISLSGYEHELVARFSETASYFLTYGRDNSRAPQYDIARFPDRIPTDLSPLSLGEEVTIRLAGEDDTRPLFESDVWLWAVMGVIMALLTWFTVKMMRNGGDGRRDGKV